MGTLLYQKSTSEIIKNRALPLSVSEISPSTQYATSHISAQNLSDKLYHLYTNFWIPINTEKIPELKIAMHSMLPRASKRIIYCLSIM